MGFIIDEHQMNVALTRARLGLIIIGEYSTITRSKYHNMAKIKLQYLTRKPCCRKGTARCRSYCFWFKVCRQHSLQV